MHWRGYRGALSVKGEKSRVNRHWCQEPGPNGRHSLTYMCLQIFTLAVVYKILLPLHMDNVISGWIGVCVTILIIWIVVKFYEMAGKKIKIFKYL